jgi:acyl-CoA reductase-like NAD-dependent aldehyde dehydrogenase
LRRLFLEFPNINGDLETGSGISCGKYSSSKTSSTPISILVLMELIGDILPPGVVNIVNGFGAELGRALVTNKSIKAAFTGSTPTGRLSDAICD